MIVIIIGFVFVILLHRDTEKNFLELIKHNPQLLKRQYKRQRAWVISKLFKRFYLRDEILEKWNEVHLLESGGGPITMGAIPKSLTPTELDVLLSCMLNIEYVLVLLIREDIEFSEHGHIKIISAPLRYDVTWGTWQTPLPTDVKIE